MKELGVVTLRELPSTCPTSFGSSPRPYLIVGTKSASIWKQILWEPVKGRNCIPRCLWGIWRYLPATCWLC